MTKLATKDKPDGTPIMVVFCLDRVIQVFQDSFEGCENGYGLSFEDGAIKICHWLTDEEKDSTILHELIHQINFAMNICLNENQVGLLEEGLFRVLRQNKWLRPIYGASRRSKKK